MMAQPHNKPAAHSLLARNAIIALLLWTGSVAGSLWHNQQNQQRQILELARTIALTNINKDMALRLWATSHGGVYVPPNDKTPPNQYLTVPSRDVVTTSGMSLTLMNPAYMLREVMRDYSELFGVKGHITSLTLTNPNNKPDPWETTALESFKAGAREAHAIAKFDGKPYFRMMRVLRMEQGCMKCHGEIGIEVGGIRGGISASIPMEPLYQDMQPQIRNIALTHLVFWLAGIGAIGFVTWRSKLESDIHTGYLLALSEREAAIQQLNQELEQRVAQRTAQLESAVQDLESFSYSVSHDLRAPLRAINGFSLILLEEHAAQLDFESKRLLNVVKGNADKMGQLIDDILEFSRTGRKEVEEAKINMEELVRSIIDDLKATCQDRRIEFNIGALPPARGDRSMIRQVWFNLLSNAVKFTQRQEIAKIEVGYRTEAGENIYYVRDNGVGFDMTYVAKLFKVFQRLHDASDFEGTGIGLAIVNRIIEKHDGRVWAEGGVNAGAAFYFSLPKG